MFRIVISDFLKDRVKLNLFDQYNLLFHFCKFERHKRMKINLLYTPGKRKTKRGNERERDFDKDFGQFDLFLCSVFYRFRVILIQIYGLGSLETQIPGQFRPGSF